MSGPVEIVLILAAIGYILVRRLMGEPAQTKRMLVLPAVLCIIGLSDVSGQIKSPTSLEFLVGTAAVSVVIGALRGASIRISGREGVAFVQYTWVTIVLWVLNVAIKFGGNFALGSIDPKDTSALSSSLMLTLGLGILAEGLVVLYRSLKGNYQVMWSRPKQSPSRRSSPFAEDLRQNQTSVYAPQQDWGGSPYGDRRAARRGGRARRW
jgi:hypothetical protein